MKNELSSKFEALLNLIPEDQSKSFLIELINALPNIVAVLNEDRRLIYSNQALQDTLGLNNLNEIFNLRPGDIFQCVNADTGPDGCGSSESCQLCGAFNALRVSMSSGKTETNDCRILSSSNNKSLSYNLRFTSIPFKTGDLSFYVVTIEDISAEKRKKELEKIFFHDVINSMAGIYGVLNILKQERGPDDIPTKILDSSYKSLSETINEQKDFASAEEGELKPKMSQINSKQLVEKAALLYMDNNGFDGKVVMDETSADIDFTSDPVILSRILTNMTKNALEASKEGDKVTISARIMEGKLVFSVHNPGYIPQDTQYQIFERSFSTKGSGRGLGTYSMKLLGENYLGGEVNFKSTEQDGTTFWFSLSI